VLDSENQWSHDQHGVSHAPTFVVGAVFKIAEAYLGQSADVTGALIITL